jgi:hypothetical protein
MDFHHLTLEGTEDNRSAYLWDFLMFLPNSYNHVGGLVV